MPHRFEDGMFIREVIPETIRGTLLFVHGLGESGLCFEPLLARPELSDHRLLVPDLPGYGRSPWLSGDPLSLEQQADHLASWLVNSQTGPVVVLGHSMGGVLALLLAERHPELVDYLIDVDGNLSLADCIFSSQAAGYGLQTFIDSGFEQMREAIFARGVEDPALRGYYVSLCLSDPRAYYHNSLDLVKLSEPKTLARRLAGLPIPVAYIAGVPGGVSAGSRQQLKASGVPLYDIAPAGHWPFIDQVVLFATLLADLLRKIP